MEMIKKILILFVVSVLTFGCSNKKLVAPCDASYCKGKDYRKVEEVFRIAGFEKIELNTIADIKIGLFAKENGVEEVSIGMINNFKKNDQFSKEDTVYITYHIKENKENEKIGIDDKEVLESSTEENLNNDIEFVKIKDKKDIKGTWIQKNSEDDRVHIAEIDEDTITIYVYFDSDESTEVYWSGSFDNNINIKKESIIKSKNYRYITDYFANASHTDIKEFKYNDSMISYNASFLGTNMLTST